MKKSTKASLIIFIVTFLVGYVMASFIPDELLSYSTLNGSILSFLGSSVAKAVGMRTVLSVAIALAVTLLVRIIDTEDKKEVVTKKTTKKEAK
ncbi:MAG: hypothetical protein IKP28_00635 [Clostridia bacterium]|nr:hypothetical protein [Clostridia bacterium]